MAYNRSVAPGDDTIERSFSGQHGDDKNAAPDPGVVQIFSGDRPLFELAATAGPLVIGRGGDCGVSLLDSRASRHHVELTFGEGRWTIADLGSRNGTFVDGAQVSGRVTVSDEALLAVGDTLFLLTANVSAFRSAGVEVRADGVVVGPRLAAGWRAIDRLAETTRVLHLNGETGTGKELAARRFHAHSARAAGPFVPVNCAAVPPSLVERLFFGARRGAYSGADVDSDGYLAAADGGTLFLDEIGDLPAEVQAKLLRAIESGEVLPLGATRPRRLDVAICSATHVDLRRLVGQGRFREDLYFRVGQPLVRLPPLRARREEIPWLIATTLKRIGGVSLHASFVEAALLRPWPGNVRELCNAVDAAAHLAKSSGAEGIVKARHLDPHVGLSLGVMTPAHFPSPALASPRLASPPPAAPSPTPSPIDEKSVICGMLARERGNVTRTALALGLHRTQLRRWLALHQIDPRQYRRGLPGADPPTG
jgi:DNA-binding NtrC family response regulator